MATVLTIPAQLSYSQETVEERLDRLEARVDSLYARESVETSLQDVDSIIEDGNTCCGKSSCPYIVGFTIRACV
jgi:hypothetical protein